MALNKGDDQSKYGGFGWAQLAVVVPQSPVELILAHYDTGRLLLLYPYKVSRPSEDPLELFTVTSSSLKWLCAFLQSATTYSKLVELITQMRTMDVSLMSYFQLSANISGYVLILCGVVGNWTNKQYIKEMLNLSKPQEPNHNHTDPNRYQKVSNGTSKAQPSRSESIGPRSYPTVVICALEFITIILAGFRALGAFDKRWEDFLKDNLIAGQTLSLPVKYVTTQGQNISVNHAIDYTFAAIKVLTQFYFILLYHFINLGILISVLAFKLHGDTFLSWATIEANHLNSVTAILDRYDSLKKAVDAVCKSIGAVLFWAIFSTIPNSVALVKGIIKSEDISLKIWFALFLINYFSVLLISAKTTAKIESTMLELISHNDNFHQIPYTKYAMLLNELQSHRIGISGLGVFTITYGFVGGIIGTMLAYGVIAIQLSG